MVIRLIKKKDESTERVKALAILENPIEPEGMAVSDPSWLPGPASREGSGNRSAGGPNQVKRSPLDPLHIEKLAFENGFRQGEKAGLETAEKKIEAMMARFAGSIAQFQELKTGLYTRAEREVVKLALEVAKKIVHREITADQDIIQSLVKVALSHAAVKSAVTLRLNPTDYNYLLQHRGELAGGSTGETEMVLVADKSIERGGCLIQTEYGDVDARIEEKFREVERSFFDGQES